MTYGAFQHWHHDRHTSQMASNKISSNTNIE